MSWRTVGLLAGCQALLFTSTATLVAINALAGLRLAPVAALATLPATFFVAGAALTTMRASLYLERVGYGPGLMRGASAGIAGALLCAAALWLGSFWLLCLGALVFGAYNAFGQYYRFAAAEATPPQSRPMAISLVLAGGLVGGIAGPTLSGYTVDLLGPRFAGAYLALTAFALAAIVLLSRLRIPPPAPRPRRGGSRPLRVLARQPKFVVAVACGAIGYGTMNLLMTSTPIAMAGCGHAYERAALVISSHVVAMFAPSFATGFLIGRAGAIPVVLAGAALMVAAVAVALSGLALAHFWWSLVLVGVGWNFLYIGGTSLLTEAYRPEERALAQGANESAIFGMQAVSSLVSGAIVTGFGWHALNVAALPLIGLVLAAVLWLTVERRAARAS